MEGIALLAVGFVVAFCGWMVVSRRHRMPCPAWLAWLVELDNPFFKSIRADAIISRLDLAPGMRVLDLGCGPGRLTIPLAQAVGPGGRVVAIDLQAAMLARAKANAERARVGNIDFHALAIGKDALPAGAFDRAVLVAVLGEVSDRTAALRQIFDALKPGGILAVTEAIADPHFQPRGRILSLASPVGFREIRRTGGRFAFTLYLERPADMSAP